ncbi:MAG: DUF1684 domain-containing protein [Chitinophagaceae bacterium]|nr:MAG: DUF1684 domain-containing protein [Chitinophagaceae bacterium]
MKTLITCILLIFMLNAGSQSIYKDSLQRYFSQYVTNHDVVKGEDKKLFRFYPVNEAYKVNAKVIKIPNSAWFNMETSGSLKKTFRVYAILQFVIHDTIVKLPIYQSQGLLALEKYKSLLFLPFTDLTSGEETYAAGRYIDLSLEDIKNDSLTIDFNKAYNPYCAYVSGKYNCPIPPKENQLSVAIPAGEKNFAKASE